MGDWRDFHRKGEKANDRAQPGIGGARWWRQSPDEAARSISANISFWGDRQRWLRQQLLRWARFYGNTGIFGYGADSLAIQNALSAAYGNDITYNVSQSAADTVWAKTTRNQPKPYCVTDKGNYQAQRLAKNRNRFISGVYYENDTFAKMALAARDAIVLGTGAIHVFGRNGRVEHERVILNELFMDAVDALAEGKPRQLHRVKYFDRDVMCEAYPDKAELIRKSKWEGGAPFSVIPTISDLVCVRESWHLPSAPGADDGKHIITIDGHALSEMMDWRWNDFPFAFLDYTPRLYGGNWGQGLMEQGQSIQLELNKIAGYIQATITGAGTNKIWVKPGSNVSTDQINDQFNAIIESEEKPEYLTPPIVQPELYEYRAQLYQDYFKLAGVAESDATSTKPKGELSGYALELVHDIGTERFFPFGKRYEGCALKIAELSIRAAMDLQEELDTKENPFAYQITSPHRGTLETVDFKNLGFKPDEAFYLGCFPVSALVSDPSGRAQQVEEYAQAGWIDSDTARDAMDFPDTGRIEGLHNASREFITKTLDAMVDKGTAYEPEKGYDKLDLFLDLAQEYYQTAKRMELPEDRLQKLRDLIDSLREMTTSAAAPMQPSVAAPANPAPPPTSQLIPNVNQ